MKTQVIIAGTQKTGKSTVARSYQEKGMTLFHTDEHILPGWSESSQYACDEIGKWDVMAGIRMVYALRKWFDQHHGKPCDTFLWFDNSRTPRTKAEESAAKGIRTVYSQIYPELIRRGVKVIED